MKTFKIKMAVNGTRWNTLYCVASLSDVLEHYAEIIVTLESCGELVTEFKAEEIVGQPKAADKVVHFDFSKPSFIPLEPIGYRFREKTL